MSISSFKVDAVLGGIQIFVQGRFEGGYHQIAGRIREDGRRHGVMAAAAHLFAEKLHVDRPIAAGGETNILLVTDGDGKISNPQSLISRKGKKDQCDAILIGGHSIDQQGFIDNVYQTEKDGLLLKLLSVGKGYL